MGLPSQHYIMNGIPFNKKKHKNTQLQNQNNTHCVKKNSLKQNYIHLSVQLPPHRHLRTTLCEEKDKDTGYWSVTTHNYIINLFIETVLCVETVLFIETIHVQCRHFNSWFVWKFHSNSDNLTWVPLVRDTLTIPGQPWIVSHAYSVVDVEQSNWLKPVLLWTIVGMPTGSGKSPLFKYLSNLLRLTRPKCGLDATKSGRLVEDARFEKWGTWCMKTMESFWDCMMNCQHSWPKWTYTGERGLQSHMI